MRNLVFLLLVAVASAKVYTMCDWAKVLKDNDMDGQGGHSLADWVCVSWGESRYNTSAINHNPESRGIPESTDYGILQINSRYWCNNGQPALSNGCNIQCSELLADDGILSINCAKRVVRDRNGIRAWVAWRKYCKSGAHNFRSQLAVCDL